MPVRSVAGRRSLCAVLGRRETGVITHALLAVAALAALGDQSIVVGALEEPQCKEPPTVAVRPMFFKEGGSWHALGNDTASRTLAKLRMSWTVAFDGRDLGEVSTVDPETADPNSWAYSRDRLLSISGRSVPKVPNKAKLFGGWCAVPSARPLVVVSRPNFKDPDGWRPSELDQAVRTRLFPLFQEQAGKTAPICPGNSDSSVGYSYRAADLRVERGYRNRRGYLLATIYLNPALDSCGWPYPDGSSWDSVTFLLRPDPVYLGRNLSLVDAGDYDNDGESELLFWSSSYNSDGYTLYCGECKTPVDFRWHYH